MTELAVAVLRCGVPRWYPYSIITSLILLLPWRSFERLFPIREVTQGSNHLVEG